MPSDASSEFTNPTSNTNRSVQKRLPRSVKVKRKRLGLPVLLTCFLNDTGSQCSSCCMCLVLLPRSMDGDFCYFLKILGLIIFI